MSNPNPFVPKGSLLEHQGHRRSRLKLAVFCVVAISSIGLVAMLIQGCKRTPPDDSSASSTMTDSNATPSDVTSTNTPTDTNAQAFTPPTGTNTMAYTPPAPPTPPPAPEPAPSPTSEYIVVAGDTLAKIAKANGVSLKALEAANPGVDARHLKVKQKLVIPASTKSNELATGAMPDAAGAAPAGEDVYVVKAGDTLSKIAKAHHVSIKALQAANNLTTTRINVGKKLKIPASAEAAAPAAPVDTTPAAPTLPPPSAPATAPASAPATAPAPAGNNP